RLTVAPTQPTDITLTVASESTAVLSTSQDTTGSKTITLTNISDTNWKRFYVQGLTQGSTTVTVTAPGYADTTATITVGQAGFYANNGNFSTTTFSANTTLTFTMYALSPTGGISAAQELRPGASATLALTNSNDAVGTLTQTSLTLQGDSGTQVSTQFDPATAGTTTITHTQPTGYTQPTGRPTSITATVTAPAISLGDVTVGKDLQAPLDTRLTVAPTQPTDITLTVASESTAVLSTSQDTTGSKTITLTNISDTNWKRFYVQGLTQGSTTVTVTAPGYADTTATITVGQAGFYANNGNFSTTTFSANTTLTFTMYALSPTGGISAAQELRPGASATLALTNSNDAVGTLTQTSLTLQGDSGTQVSTQFDPATAGTTTITHTQPTGYTQPTGRPTSITATVTAPAISLGDVTVGKDLQSLLDTRLTVAPTQPTDITPHTQPPGYPHPPDRPTSFPATVTAPAISLGDVTVGKDLQSLLDTRLTVAPTQPTDITVTVASESTAVLSTSQDTAGSKTITLTNISDTNWKRFYVQGLTQGSTTVTVTAPGYADTTATITVGQAGFYANNGNFSTATFSAN